MLDLLESIFFPPDDETKAKRKQIRNPLKRNRAPEPKTKPKTKKIRVNKNGSLFDEMQIEGN